MELVMNQLELELFWPLTQQMLLDLDYNGCDKPRMTTPIGTVGTSGYAFYNTTGSSAHGTITASKLTIDVGTTVFKVIEEPPIYRKALYKLMNIKWEKK